MHYDVIVVGAGPSGWIAAGALAAGGARVAVVERDVLPRLEICDEDVPAIGYDLDGVDAFRRLMPAAIRPADVSQIRHSWSYDRSVLAPVHVATREECDGAAISLWMVNFQLLGTALAERAAVAGISLYDGLDVRNVAVEDGFRVRVSATSRRREWSATSDFVIGADGVDSTVSRACGLRRKAGAGMAVGLDVPHRWADGPSCVRFDVCHFEWEAVDSGLGWVFPRPDRLVAGAAAFWFGDRDPPDMERHERALRHSVAEHFRALQIPLDAAETAWRVRHLRPWNGSDPLRSDDGRVLLVGDAFGLADAVFEHGLWNAMHSGFEAAKCILEHDSTAYEPAIALACLPYPEALHRHAERAVASFAGRAPRGDDRRRARAGEPRMNRESDSRAIAEGVEDGAAAAQFDAFHDRLVARIEREIRLFLPPSLDDIDVRHYIGPPRGSHAPEALSATVSIPLWDLISRKGKAWRPGFVILLTEALGKKSSGYEDLLCVLPELLHSASLIIDDIEDASPIRRGAESIHLRYGVDIALNAANTAYFLPYRIIAGHEGLTPQQRLRLYEVVNQTFLRAHIGQAMDIHQGKNVTRTDLEQMIDGHGIDRLLQMHALKTGAFSEGLAAMAAIIAGVDETTHLACSVFGREFGVAFQILDDVRNFSDSPRWTKVCGEDLTGGKPTYAVVRALERLHGRERDRLVEILCSPALRNAPDVLREGIDLVRGSGAIEACHHEAQAIFSRAWADLAPKLMEGRPQVLLHTFFVKVLDLLSDP